jgi:DNA (cytosine-5)-methyltransferase 1
VGTVEAPTRLGGGTPTPPKASAGSLGPALADAVDALVRSRNGIRNGRGRAEALAEDARALGAWAALNASDIFAAGGATDGPIDVVDLFSGCGGLSVGFDVIAKVVPSYRLAGGVDVDPWCVSTYERNMPAPAIRADLGEVSRNPDAVDALFSKLRTRPRRPWVLIGGPPCQGFSAHRKRERPGDLRNNLIEAYAAIAARVQPDLVVMENVPEILSERHWRHFEAFRRVLASEGYSVRASIHNLGAFGVPQERFRAVVIAAKSPPQLPEGFLTPSEFLTVRDAIGHLPPVAAGTPDPIDTMHVSTRHRRSTVETIRAVPRDGGRRPPGVGPACLDRVDGYRDVYGRMYWDRPANTITAYARNPASGRYAHPEQDRGLTIREAALLQSFPATYMFEGPFDHKFLQIGNAVPPAFAAYLAAHVLGELVQGSRGRTAADGREVLVPTSNSFSSGIAGRKKRGARR